jgi:WD40 repeat protein
MQSSQPSTDFCPYKGLQPYTEADRAYFFGRERDQEVIASNLYAAPLTVLYGASGVGKSSVLLAGVVPQLKRESKVALVVFRQWQTTSFLLLLKQETLRTVSETLKKEIEVDLQLPLDEFFLQCRQHLRGPIFVIFDQFEEFFLYHEPSQLTEIFDAEFARTVNRQDVHVNFLLSMRDDGLSKLDRFSGRIPRLMGNMLRLENLDRAAAEDAIRKPLEEYNRRQKDAGGQMKIEDDLPEALLDDLEKGKVASEQTGRGQPSLSTRLDANKAKIETPFLQMVLTRLWEEEKQRGSHLLRLSTFVELGKTENIARTHLDRVMEKLSAEELDVATRVLRFLVTPSGTKIAQEPGALVSWVELSEEKVQAILNRLSEPDMRVLRTVRVPGRPVQYEIFHDVMAQAILDWRARHTQEQKRLEAERRLVAERAEAEKRLAATRSRILRRGAIVLIGLLLLTFGSLYFVNRSRSGARSREIAAYAMGKLEDDPELSLLLAIEAVKERQTPKAREALEQALQQSHVQAVMPHKGLVMNAVFSPDGRLVATAAESDNVKVWEANNGKLVVELPPQEDMTKYKWGARNLTFSPNGNFLVASNWQAGTVRVWDARTWQPITMLKASQAETGKGATINSVTFSPDSKFLVTTNEESSPRVWDVATWKQIATLPGQDATTPPAQKKETPPKQEDKVQPAEALSPTLAATPEAEKAVDKPAEKKGGHTSAVYSAAFSPDERLIVTTGRNSIQLWSVDGWKNLAALTPKSKIASTVYNAVFSPDNKFIVSGNHDRSSRVWDVETRAEVSVIYHPNIVYKVAVSPNGELLATACWDRKVRIWKQWQKGDVYAPWRFTTAQPEKLPEGPVPQLVSEMRGHANWIYSVAFSPDGNYVVTGCGDKTARVWRVTSTPDLSKSIDELLALAKTRVTRELTPEERKVYLGA